MSPTGRGTRKKTNGAPRASGDEPQTTKRVELGTTCSPRERG